jgi:hypothetical protein
VVRSAGKWIAIIALVSGSVVAFGVAWFWFADREAWRVHEVIRSQLPPGMTAQEVKGYLDNIGARKLGNRPLFDDRSPGSPMYATVRETAVSRWAYTFYCSPDIELTVEFDDADRVERVSLGRICL